MLFKTDTSVITNNNLSDCATAVYIGICAVEEYVKTSQLDVIINYYILERVLYGAFGNNRKFYMIYRKGIDELQKKGIIEVAEELPHALAVKRHDLNNGVEYDTVDITKLLSNVPDKCEPMALLRFYILIMSTIGQWQDGEDNSERKCVSSQSINRIVDLTSYSRATVIKYTRILTDLELIYVNRSNSVMIDKNHMFFSRVNMYGKLADKKQIDNKARRMDYAFRMSSNKVFKKK